MLDAATKERLYVGFIRAGAGLDDARRAVRATERCLVELRAEAVRAALTRPGATVASVARAFRLTPAKVRRIAAEPEPTRRAR